jgi:hypothetical protein
MVDSMLSPSGFVTREIIFACDGLMVRNSAFSTPAVLSGGTMALGLDLPCRGQDQALQQVNHTLIFDSLFIQ